MPPDRIPASRQLAPEVPGHRWSEAEWEHVLDRLQKEGEVDAERIILDAADVQRLVQAAPRKGGKPHFKAARFNSAQFCDEVKFTETVFDYASFVGATLGHNANFVSATFGDGADFANATFGVNAAFVRAEFGSSANFRSATFGPQANFIRAHFGPSAAFNDAILGDESTFRRVEFDGDASFGGASLGDRADFRDSSLEGVSFERATIAGAHLDRARFDYRTSLNEARLFTAMVNGATEARPPRLGDVQWNGVQISGVADWRHAKHPRLGEDPDESRARLSDAAAPSGQSHADSESPDLETAIRAYRQVSVLLEDQGMHELAWEFDYRAEELAQRQRRGLARWASKLLKITTGYGHRFWRVLATYALAVTFFAVIYGSSNMTSWPYAFPASLLAFHGRGIVSTSLHFQGAPGVIVPAIEAAVGLFVEATVVAVIIRRLFRR